MAKENRDMLISLKTDAEYAGWLKELKQRYITQRLKAACAVNTNMLEYYWQLGCDIEQMQYANTYGSKFYETLSKDMKRMLPDAKGFSPVNLRYMYAFYKTYSPILQNFPQLAENLNKGQDELKVPRLAEEKGKHPQATDDFNFRLLCSIPWDHHRRIIDHCKGDVRKAIFYVRKTYEHNWSRDVLLNWLDTDLYEREGKAVSNFTVTLPALQGDLAQQMTKDPYKFDFLAMREDYDERDLEDALVANVTKFLLELGKGFSYMGRQFHLEVGEQEFFPDLLFYNAHIHAYVVIELKTKSFKPEFLGQLSFYVSAVNRQFKTDIDNPTIGLLICKDKDNVVAHYALDSYNLPIGVSEYQLSELYPKDLKSSLPTIEEIESELKD